MIFWFNSRETDQYEVQYRNEFIIEIDTVQRLDPQQKYLEVKNIKNSQYPFYATIFSVLTLTFMLLVEPEDDFKSYNPK